MAPRPPRGILGNLDSGVDLEFQYNPDELEETVEVHFNKAAPQGLSHEVLQFKNTSNHVVKFDLTFDGLTSDGSYDTLAARRFLLASVVPRAGSGNVASASTPTMHFFWPGEMFSLTCVVTKLQIKHKRFDGDSLATTHLVASVTVEEKRSERMTSEDVAKIGTMRRS